MSEDITCPDRMVLEECSVTGKVPPELKEHLEECPACKELLGHLRSENEFLLEFAGANQDQLVSEKQAGPPQTVPGYHLLRELHRGGQGVVWLAEQEGTRRRVAVKMLLQGRFATSRQRSRFEREIEVIASLRHPGIVIVFESGVTHDNEIYFAMEYVEGRPLDVWMKETQPSPEEAVEMMVSIGDAIGFAHRRGVIHRDIKPGNILVDEQGQPKVLDFGLARIEDEQNTERAEMLATAAGEFLGTFAYASPEQLTGDPNAVDTRADVYALGILMFENLTTTSPFPPVESVADLVQSRLEGVVPRPSSRRKGIGRELDLINLKALDAEPDRRYETAAEFAEDLRRLLEGRPVQARGDSLPYVLWKSINRHRLASTFILTVVLLVIASTISLGILYRESEEKRVEAEAVSNAIINGIITSMDTEREGEMPETAADFLDVWTNGISEALADLPVIEARLLAAAGQGYIGLKLWDQADEVLAMADARLQEVVSGRELTESLLFGEILHQQARVDYHRGREGILNSSRAERAGREKDALEFQEIALDMLESAEARYRTSRMIRIRQSAPRFDIATSTHHHAATLRELGMALGSTNHGDEETSLRVEAMLDLSNARFMEAREQWKAIEGESSSNIASVTNSLARTASLCGQNEKALELYLEALEMVKKHGKAKELYRIGLAHKNAGMAHRTLGQWVESVPHLDEAMVLLSDRYGPLNSRTLGAQESMVDSILRGGMDEPRVVSLSRSAFDGRIKPGESGYNYDRYVDSGVLLVDTLMVSGDTEEARRILAELFALMNSEQVDDPRIKSRDLLMDDAPRVFRALNGVDSSVDYSLEVQQALAIAEKRGWPH